METTVTSKGQVVIPAEIRRRLGIKKGTRLEVEVDERSGRLVLVPITREYVESQRGRFKGKGLLKALATEKMRERER